ncbi:hypothetical protein AGLY_008258 [Aphis glycines]|uniref:Uncharacterized protein n=1 Tax=Aphis glycines TaxID=307491 RepID=A0A6G0TNK5_APHGL|nr:hypothetical protein AGLY_008258 [Aphis glycines]
MPGICLVFLHFGYGFGLSFPATSLKACVSSTNFTAYLSAKTLSSKSVDIRGGSNGLLLFKVTLPRASGCNSRVAIKNAFGSSDMGPNINSISLPDGALTKPKPSAPAGAVNGPRPYLYHSSNKCLSDNVSFVSTGPMIEYQPFLRLKVKTTCIFQTNRKQKKNKLRKNGNFRSIFINCSIFSLFNELHSNCFLNFWINEYSCYLAVYSYMKILTISGWTNKGFGRTYLLNKIFIYYLSFYLKRDLIVQD